MKLDVAGALSSGKLPTGAAYFVTYGPSIVVRHGDVYLAIDPSGRCIAWSKDRSLATRFESAHDARLVAALSLHPNMKRKILRLRKRVK